MSFPTHEQERRFLRSKIPQANYLTPTAIAAPANFKEFLVRDKNLTDHKILTEDNKEESTGHFQATDEYKTVCDTMVQKELAICAEEIGRDLLLATGSVATTQPDATNAPTVKRHAFKVQDLAVSKQAPTMTLIEFVGSVINRLIPSLVCEDYGLKGEGTSRITSSMGLHGSGLIIEPSGLQTSDIVALSGLHYFTHSMVKLVVADSVALSNAEDFSAGGNYLASWALNLKKNLLLEEGYIPGAALYLVDGDETSGAIRSECLIQSYEFGMDFRARLLAGSSALAAVRSKKKLDVQIDIIGPRIGATTFDYKLSIHAPRVSYDTVDISSANGMYQVAIKPKIFFDTASSKDVEIILINDVASYTV
jgi:hypothetical protein